MLIQVNKILLKWFGIPSWLVPARAVSGTSYWTETLGQIQDLLERLYPTVLWVGMSGDLLAGAGICLWLGIGMSGLTIMASCHCDPHQE